jgi:hypothetical protein
MNAVGLVGGLGAKMLGLECQKSAAILLCTQNSILLFEKIGGETASGVSLRPVLSGTEFQPKQDLQNRLHRLLVVFYIAVRHIHGRSLMYEFVTQSVIM